MIRISLPLVLHPFIPPPQKKTQEKIQKTEREGAGEAQAAQDNTPER